MNRPPEVICVENSIVVVERKTATRFSRIKDDTLFVDETLDGLPDRSSQVRVMAHASGGVTMVQIGTCDFRPAEALALARLLTQCAERATLFRQQCEPSAEPPRPESAHPARPNPDPSSRSSSSPTRIQGSEDDPA